MNKATLTIVALLLILGAPIGCEVAYYNSDETVTIEVTGKETKRNGTYSDKYLIFTEGETFEVTDMWLAGEFNSSDDYGHLEQGKKYECDCYGWRIGWMSWYRNLKNCKEVTP